MFVVMLAKKSSVNYAQTPSYNALLASILPIVFLLSIIICI